MFYVSLGSGLFDPQIVELHDDDTVVWFGKDGLVEYADQNGVNESFQSVLVPVPNELARAIEAMAMAALYRALT